MNEIETGGPAFPTISEGKLGSIHCQFEGMTLLDYFAAKAMQGMLADESSANSKTLAEFSYDVAREMIAARAK